jgi:outer membrane protein OmpA-like peptidoglycan-associated protein
VVDEPVAEESVAEEPVVEQPATEEPATEEPAAEDSAAEDPAADAQARAEAEAELDITEGGEIVDPAAGLMVAEPDPAVEVEPVEAPQVSESEVESLTDLLTADPTSIDVGNLAAAELVTAAPAEEGAVVAEADPASLVAQVTETITEETARSSAEEFRAAPVALGDGRKSGLSDLEKAGLLVLGALAVGAIIKNNNEARAQEEPARVVSNTGDRVIVLQPDGTYQVLKDDDTVIRRPGSTVRTETFRDGSTRTIVERTDGTQVVTIRDATGRVLRRATYDDLGREMILFDDLAAEEVVVVRDLPKPQRRIVISSKDDDAALKRELAALEAEKAGRKFSLRQVREIPEVRALAATIDVEPVTFASGSAAIPAAEARDLADLGRVMQQLLDENPREVFLIEGHTDATGKAAMNLALSDRRAESVALALTEYFDIPPENMVVQGYGETELLIDTQASESRNRRVEVRVITPLLRTADRG